MHTLIIGGGLSGLALADMLETDGHEYMLVEGRDRFGGRIKTGHHGAGTFDLGPAWFWPGQPRVAALIARLGLKKFDQHTEGAQLFENEHAVVQRDRGFAMMQDSWRLQGGLGALSNALVDQLPDNRKRLNAQVVDLLRAGDQITATLQDGVTLQADHVVLALPPRIGAEISFAPALPDTALRTMQGVATWMAGQAKAVAVYETPFWRQAGLSGDATSRFGPMVEIHDASPAVGGPYALFGFIGVPPEGRQDTNRLRHHIQEQLTRLFGPEAAKPSHLFLKDWAFDPLTATRGDHAPLYAHPTYGLPRTLTGLWEGRLLFAGTEVAPQFGGYVEGALEAAEAAFHALREQ